jgi:hypothetical protein
MLTKTWSANGQRCQGDVRNCPSLNIPLFWSPVLRRVLVHNINSHLIWNSKDIYYISRAYNLRGTLMSLSQPPPPNPPPPSPWSQLRALNPTALTLNLLTTTIVAPPSNASKWQMGFNSAFKGLTITYCTLCIYYYVIQRHTFLSVQLLWLFGRNLLIRWNSKYWVMDKLRGFSPRANHTDRAAAAGRRS